jgi:hypothetical protein
MPVHGHFSSQFGTASDELLRSLEVQIWSRGCKNKLKDRKDRISVLNEDMSLK